jgi:DNA-directed RNA polymerase specialized sigma24 family protein
MMAASPNQNSVTQWMVQLVDGDQLAAQQIFDRYYEQLTALARRRLSKLPPQIADHEGAVNSALRSFFSAAGDGRFGELDDRDALYKLLATITLRKVAKQYRKQHGKKHGEGQRRQQDAELRWLEDRSAGPEDLAIYQQECERLVDELSDETLRQIALMMMQGLSNGDIAEKLDIHLRSVQRKTNLILGILAERA